MKPSQHPLRDRIQFDNCEHCGSEDVLIRHADYDLSPFNDQAVWEFTAECNTCQKLTSREGAIELDSSEQS